MRLVFSFLELEHGIFPDFGLINTALVSEQVCLNRVQGCEDIPAAVEEDNQRGASRDRRGENCPAHLQFHFSGRRIGVEMKRPLTCPLIATASHCIERICPCASTISGRMCNAWHIKN